MRFNIQWEEVNIPLQFYLTHYLIEEGVRYSMGKLGGEGVMVKIPMSGGSQYYV
jgi:hypothetical protein